MNRITQGLICGTCVWIIIFIVNVMNDIHKIARAIVGY